MGIAVAVVFVGMGAWLVLSSRRDARAAAIYAAAYGINPEFFAFWRSLDAYRAGLRGRNDVLVLDPSSEFFRYFRQSGGRDGARGTAK